MALPAGNKTASACTRAGRAPLGCFRCVGTEDPRAAALARVGDVEGSRLRAGLDDAFALVADRFFRREVRVWARACLGGMLSGLERKTGWSLAGHAGEASPDGMQRLFTTARWDHDGVRDDVRGYVAAALGDPDGVLIGDDTGFEKGGSASAGAQRQYTGTAGKITNCQLGVFLAYASPKGRALAGRELYLPRSWTGNGQRLAAAGVPEGTGFRTKPQLLQLMIERAVTAGILFGWVTAYGDNGPLRAYLEERGIPYVLAVACAHVLATPAGRHRADALAARLPKRAWQRMSCGDGAKGERRYDWALVASARPEISLLIRRSVSRPSELAFYLCHTPDLVPLGRLVKVAGARWAAEECFQAAKNERRRWSRWRHRHQERSRRCHCQRQQLQDH